MSIASSYGRSFVSSVTAQTEKPHRASGGIGRSHPESTRSTTDRVCVTNPCNMWHADGMVKSRRGTAAVIGRQARARACHSKRPC